MEGPLSSYSCFEIHICWKVEREARMEPPIQTEYFRSGGAMILTFMEDGARAVISFCIRSEIPGYMVVPPDCDMLTDCSVRWQIQILTITMLPYKSLRTSTSHFMIELKVVTWIPPDSRPNTDGWNSASGARKRSLPMVITCPSGSS